MSARAVFAALLSHWRRRPLQLAAALLGLALATGLWSGVQALNDQARQSYDRAAAMLGGAQTPRVMRRDGRAIAHETYIALRRAGWAVSPVLEGRLRIGPRRFRVIGVDPVTAPVEGGALRTARAAIFEARSGGLSAFTSPPFRALAGPETAEEIRAAQAAETASTLPEVVAVEGMAEGALIVDIGVAQRLLDRPGAITQLLLEPAPRGPRAPLETLGDGALQVITPEPDGDLARLTDSFHLNLTAFGLLAFVVGLFIVHSAIGLAFEQRLPTLRTLRSLGVSARALTAALLVELIVAALLAGLVGAVLGYAVAAALLPDVAGTLRGLYGAQVSGELSLSAQWWALSVAMSVAGAAVAAGQSLWKAYRLAPVAAARAEAWAGEEARRRRLQVIAAMALLVAACVAYGAAGGLLSAFALMAGVLLAAALLLPSAAAALFALGAWTTRRLGGGPIAEWFWADARQQLSGLSLALMAMLLALAANIGVGAMVESFRTTFIRWLDQRLAAELYVTPRTQEQAVTIRAWLDEQPEVRAVLPAVWVDTRHEGRGIDLLGFDDHGTYRESWPVLDTAAAPMNALWDAVAAGEAAWASEQFLRRRGLSPGAVVVLSTPDGEWRLTLVGGYADYGNPEGQLLLNADALRARYPEAETLAFGVRADPAAVERLIAALQDRFGLDANQAVDQAALKRFSRRVFEATFTVTSALSVLTLGVAGVALFASLLTLSAARLGQLAPLWAAGAPRAGLERLEIAKALLLAVVAGVAAIPLGVATAWMLLAIVNVEAFGWRLPLYHFPTQWAQAFGLALLAAALAAAPALLRLRRAQPADLARVFASDR